MERNRNSSSVTNGRNEKHIFGSSSKRKPRSFFGFVPQVFFSPLFSLFNLTPRVSLHQYSPTSWSWRRFQVCVWSFSSNSSYKRNEEREKCEPVADSIAQSSLIIEWKGNKEEVESAPPPSPLSPSSSFPSALAHLRRTSFVKEEEEEEEEEGNCEVVGANTWKRKTKR